MFNELTYYLHNVIEFSPYLEQKTSGCCLYYLPKLRQTIYTVNQQNVNTSIDDRNGRSKH